MRGNLFKADLRRTHELPIHLSPVFEEINITGSKREAFDKAFFQLYSDDIAG